MKTTRHDSFAAYVLPSVLAFALSGLYTIVDLSLIHISEPTRPY